MADNWQSQGARPKTQTSDLTCKGRNKKICPGRTGERRESSTHSALTQTNGTGMFDMNEELIEDRLSQVASSKAHTSGLAGRGRNKNASPGRVRDDKGNSNRGSSVIYRDNEMVGMTEQSEWLLLEARSEAQTSSLACKGRNKNICPGRSRDSKESGTSSAPKQTNDTGVFYMNGKHSDRQSQGARPRTQPSHLACKGRSKNVYPGRTGDSKESVNNRASKQTNDTGVVNTNDKHLDRQSQGASSKTQTSDLTCKRRNKKKYTGRVGNKKKNSFHSISKQTNNTGMFYINEEHSDRISMGTDHKTQSFIPACRERRKTILPGRARGNKDRDNERVNPPTSFLTYKRRTRTDRPGVLIVSEEELSRRIFRVLDYLGYSQEMVQTRRDAYRGFGEKLTYDNATYITAGSKGEGLTSFLENDIDVLALYNGIVVTHSLNPEYNIDDRSVLILDDTMCGPGYFQLRVGVRSQQLDLEWLFKSGTGELYVSSLLFMDSIRKGIVDDKEFIGFSGPAMTSLDPASGIQIDIVGGFTCLYPGILYDWANRKRNHGWPSPEVIREVVAMDAQLVAKGDPCSKTQKKEWRICFIPGELKLMENLNETQTKLYILLKLVKKQILHIVSDGISSYIMKNIVFWMAELFPVHSFTEYALVSILLKALKILRRSLKMNYLPYYMITGRNLLSGRMTDLERQLMIMHLTELIKEGPWIVFRINKLANAVCSINNEDLNLYMKGRDTFERMFLSTLNSQSDVEVDALNEMFFLLFTQREILTQLDEHTGPGEEMVLRIQLVLS